MSSVGLSLPRTPVARPRQNLQATGLSCLTITKGFQVEPCSQRGTQRLYLAVEALSYFLLYKDVASHAHLRLGRRAAVALVRLAIESVASKFPLVSPSPALPLGCVRLVQHSITSIDWSGRLGVLSDLSRGRDGLWDSGLVA